MSKKEKFYMTTAIAYTSGKPHIGNTYEIILADAIARYKRMQNKDVFLHDAEHAATLDAVAHGNFWLESPLLFMVYCGKIHASFDTIARHFFEFCKRSLNTVVYALDKAGGKLDGKGRARRIYVFAGA